MIMNLLDRPFIKLLEEHGKVYQVGGAVRDKLLKKQSKDLDLLVCGIDSQKIISLLSTINKSVDLVGESFGVIKFKDSVLGEIDIAIPRTERLMTTGEILDHLVKTGESLNKHKSFIIVSDPFLPIEEDLERRDFTINSIALDLKGNYIDPFNGIKDLKNKIIKMTNEKAFNEDPLRMLRAVQFASRFRFTIKSETRDCILENAHNIQSISSERILIELDKIFHKGSIKLGIRYLKLTGLWPYIFKVNPPSKIKSVNYKSEFYKILLENHEIPDIFYTESLKGDNLIAKELKALKMLESDITGFSKLEKRKLLSSSFKISPIVNQTSLINSSLLKERTLINEYGLPWTERGLDINGHDLISLGFNGKDLGNLLKEIHESILDLKLINKRDEIINWVKLKTK